MANRFAVRTGTVRGRFPKRATQWVGSTDITAFTALAAATAIFDQSVTFGEPVTVVRTRGTLWVSPDTISATESAFGALGMAVVQTQASAVGVGLLPTPITDEGSDVWFMWIPWMGSLLFADSTGMLKGYERFDFDSKAMRKVEENETVVVVIENASATFGVQYILKFRQLVKLHG